MELKSGPGPQSNRVTLRGWDRDKDPRATQGAEQAGDLVPDSPMALSSYCSASASISSELSVSSSSLESSLRILLQAKAAAIQSWLWAGEPPSGPAGSGQGAPDTCPGVMKAETPGQQGPLGGACCGPSPYRPFGSPTPTQIPCLRSGLLHWPVQVVCWPGSRLPTQTRTGHRAPAQHCWQEARLPGHLVKPRCRAEDQRASSTNREKQAQALQVSIWAQGSLPQWYRQAQAPEGDGEHLKEVPKAQPGGAGSTSGIAPA